MATLSRAESKHMYSWWWDSHISPKNSKWLQQNLTDMDSKVKQMIKLIEVDEDSFARRAEMYYKRRPELMKQVEEFYRAYRALAERYDHATGVIRQAHRTMAEAFPNQVPFMGPDESDSDPRTPETSTPGQASSNLDRDDNFTHESNSIAMEKGKRHFDDMPGEGNARRELNFDDVGKKDVMSGSETLERYETEIKALKEALANLEAEKDASLLQYQQNLQKLSNLEAGVSRTQDDSKVLREVASNAEAEVESLKESVAKLESEREANLHQYHKCLERIAGLESNISRAQEDIESQDKRASEAEKEAQLLKEELVRVYSEKEAGLSRYMEALEKIANLENKLLLAEDKVDAISAKADNAEKEVDSLKQAMARLSEEKEALALKYEKCLEMIATLEGRITLANEEIEKLKNERDQAAAKLKGAEEHCLLLERSNVSMKTELDSLVHRLGLQNEELSEKQKELGRLWTSVQEERLRFVEVESAFRTLKGLHSQTQEELRSAASELQKRVQLLKEMEIQNQSLQGEVQMVRDENSGLNEVNLSSAVSLKNLQDEIGSIRDEKAQLEGELELRLDQRNALQQEIYCLKEELKNLNKKHQSIMEQVVSVGFLPECIGSSVKDLQDENSKLKERCQRSEAEILALLDKLHVMESLFEKNALLEKSLSELGAELDNARAKVKAMEESCELIMSEKSTAIADKATLISQLEITTQNLAKLSERNTFLENSLFDVNAELETLRATSKNLEESCLLLNDEKSVLVSEKQALELDLETAQRQLEELRMRHAELENNYSGMKDERESTLRLLEELSTSLDAEKQEHSNTSRISRQKIARLENQICSLEKAGEKTRAELERELDNAMNAQLDIFILRNCMHDIREKNSALLLKCEKLLETSKLSEKLISELEYENIEQQEEVKFLTNQIHRLRMGMVQLLKALEVDLDCGYDEQELDEDQLILHRILVKLDETRNSLVRAWDENQKLIIEKSVLITLLGQLKQEVADLKTLIITLQQEFRIGNNQLSSLQQDMQRLLQSNEELILSVREGNHKENLLAAEVESLRAKLLNMESICRDLENEKGRILKEKGSLTKQVRYLDEEKQELELENSHLVLEAVSLDTLSLVFKNTVEERLVVIDQLTDDLNRMCSNSCALEDKMKIMEGKLDEVQMEKSNLHDSLKSCEGDLEKVTVANRQIQHELSQREAELLDAEAMKADQQKQILELSEKYDQQLKVRELLHESMNDLGAEVSRTREKHAEAQKRVDLLQLELQKGKDETELWETVAGSFFTELQTTAVREAFFKEKFSELSKEYRNIEDENRHMNAQLAGYIPAFASLQDCVASLESHTAPPMGDHTESYDRKDDESESGNKSSEDNATVANGFSGLEDVAVRLKAIESSVLEMKKLSEEQRSQINSKLDETKALEACGPQEPSRLHRSGSRRSSRRYSSEIIEVEDSRNGQLHLRKLAPQTRSRGSNGGDLMMKDIVLDQVSSGTPARGRHLKGYGESDDQILEMWQSVDQGGSIDYKHDMTHQLKAAGCTPDRNDDKHHQLDAVKQDRSRAPSSESLVEKEVGVDKEISKRFSEEPMEPETKKKILERLASDFQKLTNLQITVDDLKQKVEITENATSTKGHKGGAVEYVEVKDQLGEAEKSISKLLETNGKLVKKVEAAPTADSFDASSSTSSSIMESSEMGMSSRKSSEMGMSSRRRRVSEHARRCSEKIGRLQLEVQKIQFFLLKLDGAAASSKGGAAGKGAAAARAGERNTRVLLKDYLYGIGPRTPRRKRKVKFCACVQPQTSGD